MIHPPRVVGPSRIICTVSLLLALAGCGLAPNPGTGGGGGQTRSDQAMIAGCRQRADQSFERANRATLYQPSSTRDSPYSGVPAYPNSDLADKFSYGTLYNDCMRSNGAAATPSTVTPPEPAPAPAPAKP